LTWTTPPVPFVMEVYNEPLSVGPIRIIGVASASSVLLGDTESITLYSFFDTPPESLIVGPMLAPLPAVPETGGGL